MANDIRITLVPQTSLGERTVGWLDASARVIASDADDVFSPLCRERKIRPRNICLSWMKSNFAVQFPADENATFAWNLMTTQRRRPTAAADTKSTPEKSFL